MGFCTALQFYRPTAPPQVTCESLAAFVGAFCRLGLAKDNRPIGLEIKFGDRIDREGLPLSYLVESEGPQSEVEWDIAIKCAGPSKVSDAIATRRKSIHRAHLFLGYANPHVRDHVSRTNCPDNDEDLIPDMWTFNIGPVVSLALGRERAFPVGWLGLVLSGDGYIWPESPTDLVGRAESHPSIARAMELCRSTWPVAPTLLDRNQIDIRRQMGDLWPYKELKRPWDWYWGTHES